MPHRGQRLAIGPASVPQRGWGHRRSAAPVPQWGGHIGELPAPVLNRGLVFPPHLPVCYRAAMARILGIRIRRFKALADVRLGKITPSEDRDEMPPIACLIGPNGCGKSTLLDAFGFLADCLRENVEAACDKPHRGGFERLRTQGEKGPIEFEILYRQGKTTRPIFYQLSIQEKNGTPYVAAEVLKQARGRATHGQLYTFLKLEGGRGR